MLLILLILSVCQKFYIIEGNSLTVMLDSKWSSTPLLAEASEFIASESPKLFWKFVNELNHVKENLHSNNDIINYEIVSKISKKLLNSGQISVLQLSLAMRTYSPAVEMNHQLDTDFDCSSSLVTAKLYDKVFCKKSDLEEVLLNKKNFEPANVTLYKTDKIYPGVDKIESFEQSIPIVFIYGDLQDQSFYEWHEKAIELSKLHKMHYVFRHRVKNRSGKTRLSGYGVELAIKSTEYKAVDDMKPSAAGQDDHSDSQKIPGVEKQNSSDDVVQGFIFSKLKDLYPNSNNDLDAFKHHLLTSDSEIRPLKSWQIQELSLKAGQFVMNALANNEALETLRDISQNYPTRANYLAQVPVSQDFKNELMINQVTLEQTYNLPPGHAMVTFNGYILSQDFDMFEILDLARREMGIMTKLHDFGLQGNQISSLMNVQHTSNEGSNSATHFILDIRKAPITYINNLEKDRRYSSWPRSVADLLTPTYPGMMRRVAKNFFNTILVLDPATLESRDYVKFVEAFIIHNAPIRMGFLWAIDPNVPIKIAPGRALVRAFNFVSAEKEDPLAALSFITDLYTSIDDSEEVTVEIVKRTLKSKHPDVDMEMVFGESSDYDDNIKASWKYLHESGILNLPRPFVLMNGLLIDSKSLQENGFEESVVNNVLLTTNELQKLVLNQQLSDGTTILDATMSSENVVDRLHNKLLQNNNPQFISFTKSSDNSSENLQNLSEDEISTHIANNMKYFIKNDDVSDTKSTTIWIVLDSETIEGRNFFHESLKWIQTSQVTRIGLILNPSEENENGFWNRLIYNIIKKLPLDLARKTILALLTHTDNELSIRDFWKGYIEQNVNIRNILGDVELVDEEYLKMERLFVKNVLKGKSGEAILIANGKVYGPFENTEILVKDDFKLVERSCSGAKLIMSRLRELLGGGVLKSKLLSDLTNKIHAVLQKDMAKASTSAQVGLISKSKKIDINNLKEEYTGFSLMGHMSKPAFDLVAILDPLSRAAQKLSHIMIVLKETLNLNVRVIFNCKDKLSEQPLKSFYRFVLDGSPVTRDENGNIISLAQPKAQFSRLPGQPLLTLGLEPIHNWIVEPTKSVYDLDNLRFSDVKNGVTHAYFELESLLLEGHCVDMTTGQPPRGLQFVLASNNAQKTTHDTIVMANLGYFQLKANPGAWNLRLRDGKSRDIYDILDHEYTDSDDKSSDLVAVLNSFRAKIIRVKVNKKPNKANENLLSESKLDEETGSIWASISNVFSKTSSKTSAPNETINIFSVASGHLYERFLRIMMVSVLKNTKSNVKFWFLKNYLSPTFKEFIPHMAKKYGFEYDLVQYKWPRWLHQQTEKQRIIWGYKILFLDVLFPLNISKIIFVDADQIVRADMKELVDLDLEGAPYGYTPFCSSKPEMDGFRFWKSGYWSQHLAGRPYHISALYVVDLNRFRLMAAGDRLRGQYHGLSQDPNSLANLDQDLPNNMIHQVPIKSLPQEWLWCETWCSLDEKSKAKTIDLCNNPMTKEPKLSAAIRILPEWKGYDEEIKGLWNDVYSMKPKEPYPSDLERSQIVNDEDIPPKPARTDL